MDTPMTDEEEAEWRRRYMPWSIDGFVAFDTPQDRLAKAYLDRSFQHRLQGWTERDSAAFIMAVIKKEMEGTG